jgi:16S rRNA (cytidine1402-2'-O)-methyltransferase
MTTTAMRPAQGLLAALAEGKSVAYASEAGTPLVADPGLKLARAVIEAGHRVLAAPGASAVLAALSVAGLPTDRFLFAGFPPAAAGARTTWLEELAAIPATLVIYESPKRVSRLLGEMAVSFGKEREAALCRELTKRFEEVTRGSLANLPPPLPGARSRARSSCCSASPRWPNRTRAMSSTALRDALATLSVKDAAAEVPRNSFPFQHHPARLWCGYLSLFLWL